MADNLEPPQSRAEAIAMVQIELQKEANALLRDIIKRLPTWTPTFADHVETVRRASE